MKKLMIVLAALAMACATQAATIKWSTGVVKLPNGSTSMTASNVTLYFYAENVADPWASKATPSGEGDAITYAIAESTGFGSKAVSKGNATITPSVTYSNGETAYSTVILWYDADGNGTVNVGDSYMTGTGSFTLESDVNVTKSVTMGSWTQITASSGGGGGDSGAPEPTSGLLLLVGAGILGLRRKQK